MNIADLTDITVPAKAFTDIIMVVIKDVIDVTDVIVIADYSHIVRSGPKKILLGPEHCGKIFLSQIVLVIPVKVN